MTTNGQFQYSTEMPWSYSGYATDVLTQLQVFIGWGNYYVLHELNNALSSALADHLQKLGIMTGIILILMLCIYALQVLTECWGGGGGGGGPIFRITDTVMSCRIGCVIRIVVIYIRLPPSK